MSTELWTLEEVADYIGTDSIRYADNWLRRQGIRAFIRQPGRKGKNLYRAEDVRAAKPGGVEQ